jgi:nucleoside-diphosphate-sugar epimerase
MDRLGGEAKHSPIHPRELHQGRREWAGRIATILRPAPVYGRGNEANLAAFVRQIRRGRPCMVGAGEVRKSVVGRGNLCAAIGFLLARDEPGYEIYNVSDAETFSVAGLARLAASLGGWPTPKSIPATLATLVAPLGDVVGYPTGRDFPLTTSRLRALHEESVFPCDKLVAAGFRQPKRTQNELLEMIEWPPAR